MQAWDHKRAEAEWLVGVLRKAGHKPVAFEHEGRKVVGLPLGLLCAFMVGADAGAAAGRESWMLGNFSLRAEVTPGSDPVLYFPLTVWPEQEEDGEIPEAE